MLKNNKGNTNTKLVQLNTERILRDRFRCRTTNIFVAKILNGIDEKRKRIQNVHKLDMHKRDTKCNRTKMKYRRSYILTRSFPVINMHDRW